MKNICLIIVIIILSFCSDDPREYRMENVYNDYYKQQEIEEKLSENEKKLISEAEQRYADEKREKELLVMTIKQIIDDQKKFDEREDIDNISEIKIKDKEYIEEGGKKFITWNVLIKNKCKKDIIRLQGWLRFVDMKSEEILRFDTLDCGFLIRNKKTIEFTTGRNIFEKDIPANRIIYNLSIDSLNKMLEWEPLLVLFSDSTQLLRTNQ
jgi:hypothetical protein